MWVSPGLKLPLAVLVASILIGIYTSLYIFYIISCSMFFHRLFVYFFALQLQLIKISYFEIISYKKPHRPTPDK